MRVALVSGLQSKPVKPYGWVPPRPIGMAAVQQLKLPEGLTSNQRVVHLREGLVGALAALENWTQARLLSVRQGGKSLRTRTHMDGK